MKVSLTNRSRIVAAGARWMDKHYPNWYRGVISALRANKFNILSREFCVIGAGTGHIWTSQERDRIQRSVIRSLRVPTAQVQGLTAKPVFEPFWIIEAYRREAKDAQRRAF